MTLWQIGGIAFGLMVYPIAWFWGGRQERLGAGVLLFSCLLSMVAFYWEIWAPMTLDGVSLMIIGWLCFRSDRWWPFVATASGALTALTYVIKFLDPTLSQYALVSAHVGLDLLIDLTLLFGVFERWLTGAPPASSAAWAKADRATAARRNRRDRARAEAGPALNRNGVT